MFGKPKVLMLLLIVMAFSISSLRSEDEEPFKVFILAGQSNMVGSGKSDELPPEYQTPPKNVRVLSRTGQLARLNPKGRFGRK